MANQSATNVLAALKRETTFGTEASATGADRLRFLDSPGLKLSRANIESEERRDDQLQHIGRLGGKSVTGSYNTEVNPGGDFDLLVEDLVRGTIGSLGDVDNISLSTQVAKIETPAAPVYRSYTVEQRYIDIDQSETFLGTRVIGADFALEPNRMARVSWNMLGVDRNVKATGASPYYTTPTLTTGLPLIADDATITYAGSGITTLTGLNLSVATDAAAQPVIGSFVSPDIFMNMLRVSGDVMAIRQDLDALDDFDAETEFELRFSLSAPGAGAVLTFGAILPRVKIMDVDAPFSGGDAAMVETRQFWAHPPAGQSNAIEFYTSTETPVAHTP